MDDLHIIKSRDEHETALAEVERLVALDPEEGTPEGDRLEVLSLLVERYEREHFPVEHPTAVEAIKFRMEEQGLRQADLEPCFGGSRSRVSEVLSGRRGLTVEWIRALHEELGIPLEVLVDEARPRTAVRAKTTTRKRKRGRVSVQANAKAKRTSRKGTSKVTAKKKAARKKGQRRKQA